MVQLRRRWYFYPAHASCSLAGGGGRCLLGFGLAISDKDWAVLSYQKLRSQPLTQICGRLSRATCPRPLAHTSFLPLHNLLWLYHSISAIVCLHRSRNQGSWWAEGKPERLCRRKWKNPLSYQTGTAREMLASLRGAACRFPELLEPTLLSPPSSERTGT